MGEHGASHAGGLVRALRQKAGLTQRQLAEAAGVSVGVVRDLEQGRTTRPHGDSVRRLTGALRLTRQQVKELDLAARGNDRVDNGAVTRHQADGLRIGVLGPLAAWRGAMPVTLGPPMQRAVLGLLALSAGTRLSRSEIIEALWGDDPPSAAVSMVQSYISRIRRLLRPGEPVSTVVNGYRLELMACKLDLRDFGTLVRRASQAQTAGELATACQAYADALALWRGDPLADCEVLRNHPAVVRLSQQKADVVTAYADVAITARCPDRCLPQLRQLTDREPLNERAHALLMIALAGCGQQATALGIFDRIRQRLDHELGIRPGSELTAAQARVLNQQIPVAPVSYRMVMQAAPGAVRSQLAGRQAPRQLPGAAAHFVGRTAELATLNAAINEPADKTIVISAIAGTAGVGKTALAIHWAHQVCERFPDGQLYLNLRGYDPGQPLSPTDALARFLRALGVPGQDIPPEEDECAAHYRSLLAGKRMLIVLDNAESVDQVRPLLPGTPTCVVVVTSRDSLAGLVARDGATRLDLDLLPLEDAVGLLRTLIGARVDTHPDAAADLANQCCRLPLALRIAAELATSHRGVPLAELTGELANLHKRLDLLVASGDRHTAVRAVFSWSYHHLSADAARTFRLLGLHPGPDFEFYAAAALTGMTAEHARQMLEVLARAHLIQASGPDRYGMHDLLRSYALERATAEEEHAERRRVLTRLFDYYLGTVAAAMDTVVPDESHGRPRILPPSTPFPAFTGAAAARAWLDAERATLVNIAAHTAAHGWPEHATRLAATMFRYLESGGYYPELSAIHGQACLAARDVGDQTAEALALQDVSVVDLRQGRYRLAEERLRQALAVFRQTGERTGEARALGNLGIACFLQGRYAQAIGHYQQALCAYLETGERAGVARTLNNLGLLELRLGHYQQASDHLHQVITLCRETGNQPSAVNALSNLGLVHLRLGHYQQASDQLHQALALCRETGNRASEADALSNLGLVHLRLGHYQQASDQLHQALALCRETGDQSSEPEALNGLGEVCLATGRTSDAAQNHEAALGLASKLGDKYEQARAHYGLGRVLQAAGASGQARRHWREALSLYASLGVPDTGDIHA